MKKFLLISILSAITLINAFSLEVNKSELQNANNSDGTIEFINYTGPHKVIDSVAAIKEIGSSLGKLIVPAQPSEIKSPGEKYYVIHAVDTSVNEKFDADIIILGKNAGVDHIVNLRRIISAYLSAAYGYSESDSETLAFFITVYNAVYRGNIDVFKAKYKDVVIKSLSSENCGLSVNYKDWPGHSEIVIPLYDINSIGISTVNTSVISDTKVIQSMKEDDDKNIENRKNMVDIKERESEEASEKAKTAQKQAVEEQNKLKEEQQKTEETKKEADEAQKEAEEKQMIADANPDDEEAQKEAEEAKKEAEEKQKALEEQEAKEEEQKEKTEEAKQEAKEQQTLADKKQTEAQSERKEIAKDQNEVQKREAEIAKMNTEYGIVLADEEAMLSKLVKFNTDNGEIVKSSPVTVIRNRTIYKTSDSYIAIAGETSEDSNKAIKLILLDPETMEITAESDYSVAASSVLVKDGNDYFCVVSENESFYVAKFDETLSLKLKSDVSAKAATPITITDSGIVITDSNGKLKLLNKNDLTEVKSSK